MSDNLFNFSVQGSFITGKRLFNSYQQLTAVEAVILLPWATIYIL